MFGLSVEIVIHTNSKCIRQCVHQLNLNTFKCNKGINFLSKHSSRPRRRRRDSKQNWIMRKIASVTLKWFSVCSSPVQNENEKMSAKKIGFGMMRKCIVACFVVWKNYFAWSIFGRKNGSRIRFVCLFFEFHWIKSSTNSWKWIDYRKNSIYILMLILFWLLFCLHVNRNWVRLSVIFIHLFLHMSADLWFLHLAIMLSQIDTEQMKWIFAIDSGKCLRIIVYLRKK